LALQLESKLLGETDFPLTWEVLTAGLAEEVAPGYVAGIWQKDKPDEIGLIAMGSRRLKPAPNLPMTPETVFDIASVSKVFATAALTAVLVDRGWIGWDTPLSAILPEYPHNRILIRHLLAHTAGLPAWVPLWEKLWKKFAPEKIYHVPISIRQRVMRDFVFDVLPEAAPGEKEVYSDLTFLLLGFALEEITQMPLDRAVARFLWSPMGIRNAFYHRITKSPNEDSGTQIEEGVAATEDCPHRGGVLQGQVQDDNCWAMGGYGGHAGVFTTVREILHFVRALMTGFLSNSTLEALWTRVPEPPGCHRTLGWDTPSKEGSSVGTRFSRNSVGHLGFAGTSLWIDLDAELAVVLLSNRVHPSRENHKFKPFRARFHEAIRQDLKR